MRPWDRQEGESELYWLAFAYYRDMELRPRNMMEVAKAFDRSGSWVSKLSSKYKWRSRVEAYDRWIDSMMADAIEHGTKLATRRQLCIVRRVQRLVGIEVAKRLYEAERSPKRVVGNHDLAKLMDISITKERLILGDATERVETTIDPAKLSDDELIALKEIQKKARK